MTVLLTPVGIQYLTQIVFAGAIVLYLGSLLWRRAHKAGRPRHLLPLFMFLGFFTIFIFLGFVIDSVPSQSLNALFLQNVALAIGVIFALQFAYSFPDIAPKRHTEMRIALTLNSLYAVWETIFAALRYYQLYQYNLFLIRPIVLDLTRGIVGIWLIVVLLRQAFAFSAQSTPSPWWKHLWSPQGRGAKAVRDLTVLCVLPVSVELLSIIHNHTNFSNAIYQTILSSEVFIVLFGIIFIYLNAIAELVGFVTKVIFIALAISLFVLGIMGWIISPLPTKYYRPPIPERQTFRFIPQDGSASYSVIKIPYDFVNDLGHKVVLSNNETGNSTSASFTFPFYGAIQQNLFISANGAVAFGAPLLSQNMQYRYGMISGIVPLYLHLDSTQPEGGVFENRFSDRLIITWYQVPAYYYPNAAFTYQLILYSNGNFDITYGDLPSGLNYNSEDAPGYNPWFSGVLCNAPSICNVSQPTGPVIDTQWPKSIWMNGFVSDYYLGYRKQLSAALKPLLWLILGGSLFILLGLASFLKPLLIRPLESLVEGIQQVNAGKLDISLPVFYQDEVGFITTSFNAMMKQLNQELYNREALQASPFPLIVIRPSDAEILMANEAAADYFHVPAQELQSAHITDSYVDPEIYRNVLKEFKEDNRVTNKVISLDSRNGETRYVQINLFPIHWFGESCMIVGFVDITVYRQVEALLRKSAERWSTLYAASQEIGISLDMENVCDAVYRAVQKIMPCEDFIIDLYNEEENQVVPVYIIQHSNERVNAAPYFADHGLAGLIVHTGQFVRLDNQQEIKDSGIKFEPYGNNVITSSVLAVPMWYKGKLIGMLSAQSYFENAYRTEDEELLEMLAIQTAIAIENTRLFASAHREIAERKQAEEQLRQRQDEVTALENRERIGRELREWLGEVVSYINAEIHPEQPPPNLTARQWEILNLVAEGMTYKEVGTKVHLTERAVKYHMAQILQSLQLKGRREAIEYARKRRVG